MKRNLKRMLAAGCCALIVFLSSVRLLLPYHAAGYDDRCAALADEIMETVCGGDLQSWLDTALPERVGMSSADWYAIAAAQRGYDVSAYSAALQAYLAENEEPSATTRERMALALTACEPQPPAVCSALLDQSAGKMGIMSWIFALHLLNNGVSSGAVTAEQTVRELVSRQAPDGGWSLAGDSGDPDVTAMTLQALAPYRDTDAAADAVERGIAYLSEHQLPSGAYQSFGTENPESTAQVWIALCALGTDPLTDSRFIQNGNTLLDGILQFRLSAGCYAHAAGGAENQMAAMQTYLALTAAELQQQGRGSLLLFRGAEPVLSADDPPETPQQTANNPAPQQTAESPVQTDAASDAALLTTAAASAQTTVTGSGTTAIPHETQSAISETVTTAANPDTGTTAAETARTTAPPNDPRSNAEKYPYRIPLTAAAGAGFGIAAVVFLIRKNRSAKTYLTLGGGFLIVTALIWFIKIESPEQYYQAERKTGGGTVTMAIRCDVICGLPGSEAYPADGVIMPLTEFSIAPEESALDLLYDAVRTYTLQVEVDGISGETVETAYVRGIASLYEFDFGDLSGWTYTVNGVRPSVGCGACKLHDGDCVVWEYTVNL